LVGFAPKVGPARRRADNGRCPDRCRALTPRCRPEQGAHAHPGRLPSRRCHRYAAGAAQHTSPSSCTSRRSPRHPRDPHIPADATSVQAFGGDVGARRPVLV